MSLRHLVLALLSGLPFVGFAQNPPHYLPVNETKFIETKWRYTYALHVESNTTIHQAGEDYEYFIYFKYDYTYQQYLNGEFSQGSWNLNGAELGYNFRRIPSFSVARFNNDKLVLEFTQPNSKGTYQYHYVRVTSSEAPFQKAPNELPDVLVESQLGKTQENSGPQQPIFINIELIGGGYYGGPDPVIRDFIHIKTDGRLIQEFKSVNRGLMVNKKNIPREDLEALADYILAKQFFDFERIYDCQTLECQSRQRRKPTPIPLRLAVTYGNRRKVVTVMVWGRDDNRTDHYIEYPKELDDIIYTIQKLASRPGDER